MGLPAQLVHTGVIGVIRGHLYLQTFFEKLFLMFY
jgi:hypothetical protein